MSDARDAHVSVHFAAAPGYATHEVLNQAGALADYNAYTDDKPLVDAMRVFGADWADAILRRAGMHVGSEKVQYLARQANRHLPELRTHDRFGNRIDVVEFHPAYHELMGLVFGTETHSFAWTHQGKQGAHVARAALSYIWNQGENGICCPMGMTFASIPALRHDNQLYDEWAPHILKNTYDDRPLYAKKKAGNTVGMAMTEKQGGSSRHNYDSASSHQPSRLGITISAHRSQMVLLRSDERHISDACSDRERPFLFCCDGLVAGRLAKSSQNPAVEGQVWQQIECVFRSGVL